MLTLESRAVSLKPGPDVYCGNPDKRREFLSALLNVSLSVIAHTSREAGYEERARKNRNRIAASRILTGQHSGTGGSPTVIDEEFYKRASGAAFRKLSWRSIPRLVERDDLLSVGYLAILEVGAIEMALAVDVAYCAMVDDLRKENVRQRDREWSSGTDSEPDGILDGERSYAVRWPEEPRTSRRYSVKAPGTAGRDAALWDAIKALPARQGWAVRLQMDRCSYEEIAQQMGGTSKSIERLLARARESVKEYFRSSGGFAVSKTIIQVGSKIPGNSKSDRSNMLLTVAEVARRLGVSEKTARVIVRDLPSVRVGKRNRYPAEAVAAFANSGRVSAGRGNEVHA